ncbi:MAG: alpha-amylase family glycosyl hydrolase [Chloroflexota bacterium]
MDWYIWRDPSGVDRHGHPMRPTTGSRSSAARRGQPGSRRASSSTLHTFLVQQPELNWRSPAMRRPDGDIPGLAGPGVDGFRLDVFNAFFKHADLPDSPAIRDPRRWHGRGAYFRQEHLYDKDQPELHDWLREFRGVVDERPGRMTVGEQFSGTGVAGALPFVGHAIWCSTSGPSRPHGRRGRGRGRSGPRTMAMSATSGPRWSSRTTIDRAR